MEAVVRRAWWRDFSMPALAAGFITVLVGFASSAVIVFQAAQAVGANPQQTASWMWALGLGMGITCIGLSLRYRVPVVTAWSTPGAAMLVVGAGGASLAEATGAFLLAATLGTILGFSGLFARMMKRVPMALAAGMLAGVLLRFGLDVFVSMGTRPGMAMAMLATWLVFRRWLPRHAVIATLLVGIGIASVQGSLQVQELHLQLATPVWISPRLSWTAVVGIAVPLLVVTMASQNVPGVAVIRASGHDVPVSPVIGWIGVVNMVLAPFGAFALNLAAITAAICMGEEAHEDPARRYTAAIAAGGFYLLVGLFGATVAALFAAFPGELIACVAGIALFGTIGNSLGQRAGGGTRPRGGAGDVPGDGVRRVAGRNRIGVLGAGGRGGVPGGAAEGGVTTNGRHPPARDSLPFRVVTVIKHRGHAGPRPAGQGGLPVRAAARTASAAVRAGHLREG